MGIFDRFAGFLGESLRIKVNANQAAKLDEQTKSYIENLIQSAQNGNVNAMFQLGVYYFNGQYVGYNPQEACYWWTEAANRGSVGAQYNLGLLYDGEISTYYYDENLAGYWFNMAAANGDQEARNMLNHYRYNNFTKRWSKI